MKRIVETRLASLAIAMVMSLAGGARAQQCILGPVALPGLSGPPEWEDFDASGFWRPELHDPRWSGAPLDFLSFVPGSGLPAWSEEVGIRVVANGPILYVSFQANSDDLGPNADDYVYIGLTDGGTGGVALRIAADLGGTAIAAPPAPPPPNVLIADSPAPRHINAATGITTWTSTDGTTWPSSSSAQPTWLKAAVWDRPSGSPRWAVTLRLDLSPTGLNVTPGNMRMFFGATVNKSTGDILVGNATPKTASDPDRVGDSIIPSHVSNWVDHYYPGTICTNGVSLVPTDVGVWSGPAGSYSGGTLTNRICAGAGGTGTCAASTGVNTFRVTARKVDNSAGIATHAIRARVRIADWGSQVPYWNSGRWTDVARPNAAGTAPTGTGIFNASASALNSFGWTWLTPVDAGDGTSAVTIDYTCSKQGSDSYCPKLADETQAHQCILVELGQPPPGAGVTPPFLMRNNAVFRNMNFENLSVSDVPATISLAGLKDVLGAAEAKDRDVYLYVESTNLPPHQERALWLPTKDMELTKALAERVFAIPTVPGKYLPTKPTKVLQPGSVATVTREKPQLAPTVIREPVLPKEILAKQRLAIETTNRLALSQAKLSNGLPIRQALAMQRDQLLDTTWPTYRIRVYYDSGKTIIANKKTQRVLVPMVPFGYRFNHDGALYGFSQALSAMPGVTVQPIGTNWFKLEMKSEGTSGIRTRVVAEEVPKTSGQTTTGLPTTVATPCPTCPTCPKPVEPGAHCNCRVAGLQRSGWLPLVSMLTLGSMLLLRRRRRTAQ
jgi:hypothetical protein